MFARVLTDRAGCAGSPRLREDQPREHRQVDSTPQKGPAQAQEGARRRGPRSPISRRTPAANLIKTRQGRRGPRPRSSGMSPGRRAQVHRQARAAAVGPRADRERERCCRTPQQIAAKDALVTIRKYADDAQTPADRRLPDRLVRGHLVRGARARPAPTLGAAVMRMIGPPAAKKLISVVNGDASPRRGRKRRRTRSATSSCSRSPRRATPRR